MFIYSHAIMFCFLISSCNISWYNFVCIVIASSSHPKQTHTMTLPSQCNTFGESFVYFCQRFTFGLWMFKKHYRSFRCKHFACLLLFGSCCFFSISFSVPDVLFVKKVTAIVLNFLHLFILFNCGLKNMQAVFLYIYNSFINFCWSVLYCFFLFVCFSAESIWCIQNWQEEVKCPVIGCRL